LRLAHHCRLRIMKLINRIIFLAALLPLTVSAAELQPFSLTYAVNYSLAKGESSLALSSDGNGTYTLQSTTTAKGMAKLIASDPITERAEFRIDSNGDVQALSYQLDDGSDKENEDINIRYNWDTSQAIVESSEGEEQKPLSAGTMDQLIMQAAAIASVQAGKETFSYYQLKPGRDIDRYEYKKVGEETLKTDIGEIDTLKYSRGKPGSEKLTYFWFAPAHAYAPIRLERIKKGKVVFKGVIKSFE
jgi:hypothetical protein